MTVQELIEFLSKKNPSMEVLVQTHEDGGACDLDEEDWMHGYSDGEIVLETARWIEEKDDFNAEWGNESLILKAHW